MALISVLVIIVDQLSKLLVLKNISETSCIHVIPGVFDFVFAKNTGAAFSIMSDSTFLLGIISVIFCVCVCLYAIIKKPKNKLLTLALALLFSGALANAADRLIRGYVIDFIRTAFMDFPVFNVADIAITTGAALLVIYLIFFDKDDKKDADTESTKQ